MVKIRRFKAGEEVLVIDLINRIMNKEFGSDAAAYPTGDIERLSESYGALGEAFFVAADNGKIVGTVGIKKEDDRVALLRRLFVDPPYRRKKIGMELIDCALRFCHEVGYSEIVFKTTSKMEKAIGLCQKRGFVQRAKLKMGPIELLKYSLSIRGGLKAAAEK